MISALVGIVFSVRRARSRLSRTSCKFGVEKRLELGVGAPQSIDHLFRPIEVFAPTLERPIRRRRTAKIPQIANLVRELHEFCASAESAGVLHLQALALLLRQRFVVGDFGHHRGYLRSEGTD